MKVRVQDYRRLLVVVVMLTLMTACKDDQLTRLSIALDQITQGLTALNSVVTAASRTTPPLLTDAQVVKIATLEIQMNKANREALLATQKIAKLDPASRQNLQAILTPVIAAVDAAVNDPEILRIQNEKTRNEIRASLVLFQTTLSTTQVVLAASK